MARTSRYLDWQPTNFYGQVVPVTVPGLATGITYDRVLFGSTQIAFFEDDFPLKRLVGHVKVDYQPVEQAGNSALNICQRIRMVMENQTTGYLQSAGDDMNAVEVAEDSFLAEKRFRLYAHGTVADNSARNSVARNDYPDCDPWFANWDVRVQRTFGLPWALVLSTQISSATAGDVINVVDYMRGLVRK